MKKIYGFYTPIWYLESHTEVKEFEVVKETDKQYKIKNDFPSTISKATMEVSGYKFYETKEQAIKGMVEHCKRSIEWCEKLINDQRNRISAYQRVIEVCEKEIKQ